MQSLRQGFLWSVQPGGPRESPHRRETFPLWHLRETLLRGREPEEAPASSHRGETLQLWPVWEEVCLDLQPEDAPAVCHRLRTPDQGRVRTGLITQSRQWGTGLLMPVVFYSHTQRHIAVSSFLNNGTAAIQTCETVTIFTHSPSHTLFYVFDMWWNTIRLLTLS